MRYVLLMLALSLAAGPGTSRSGREIPPGKIVDPVATASDPAQSYALYLPSIYTPEQRWPLLIVMDPRGRGALAAEVFREGAERFGWIVAASNDSASDTADNPNDAVVRALGVDLPSRFSVDTRRVHLAGFSGTSRFAWTTGYLLREGIAGVIGCGGGLPAPDPKLLDVRFDYFGAAGRTDFNHAEMRRLDARLDGTGVAHRFAFFDGGHEWLPPGLAADAIGWLEVRAMRSGSRPRDTELAMRLFEAGLADARRLESESRPFDAWRGYESLARDYAGLVDVAPARRAASRLAEIPVTAAHREAIETALEDEATYQERSLQPLFAAFRAGADSTSVGRLAAELRIEKLRARGKGTGEAALSARRMLENAFVYLGFYVPRDLAGRGEHLRAARSLELAAAIETDHIPVLYRLTVAYTKAGYRKRALRALDRALAAGLGDLSTVENDPELKTLVESAEYRRWRDSRTGSVPGSARED